MNRSIDGKPALIYINSDGPKDEKEYLPRDRSRFDREHAVSRCHQLNSMPPPPQLPRRSFHDPPLRRSPSPEERGIGNVRLMNCFNTPNKQTIFGRKNFTHWDSFKKKYSSPSFSDKKNLYNRPNFHQMPRENRSNPSTNRKGTNGRNQTNHKSLPTVLLRFLFPRSLPRRTRDNNHVPVGHACGPDEDVYNDDEGRRMKPIPLVGRYSKYFERRSAR